MPGDKLRFRFAKTGTLRLLSHHDLMRCFERMLRRAGLPFKSTAGFHPSPRVVFALSSPLGVVALDEVVEIEFTRELDEAEVLAALRTQAPAGLAFTRVTVIPIKATAVPRRVVYRLPLPEDRAEGVAERCRELLAEPKVWVERLKPNPKRLNIRPYLRDVGVAATGLPPCATDGDPSGVKTKNQAPPTSAPEGPAVVAQGGSPVTLLDLWVTQTGTARADELVKLLGLADLLDAGAILERTLVEVRDEVSAADPTDHPPDGPADTLPLDPAAVAALAREDDEQPTAHWGLSPAGPVVE